MKTIPTASTAASSSAKSASTSASAAATPVAATVTRPAASASAAARPQGNFDYRANVERQSREQKSVGNILSYIVYGFLAIFVITVALAGYGANVIFAKIHDQSVTVSDLDARYAAANKDLQGKLAATQQTLSDAQAQITRQQDLIIKQQDAINKLIAATNQNSSDIKKEAQSRAQETTVLRARVRELDSRIPPSKY